MRRIPLSHRSHVIGFQALETGVTEHESALERDFVTLASFLDGEVVITAQPVTIAFEDGGRQRRYTPDFRVAWSDGRTEIVEIKYRSDVRANWSELRPRFVAAREWSHAHDARFRIATESSIRGPMLAAAKRLLPLRRVPMDAVLAAEAIAMARSGERTIAELVAALPACRSAALGVVWRLIARDALRVDLARQIEPGSRVWAP